MDSELRRRALHRAVGILGRNALRGRLGVADSVLESWLAGWEAIPDHAFDVAVELVLDDDIARAAEDRREGPRRPAPRVDAPPWNVARNSRQQYRS